MTLSREVGKGDPEIQHICITITIVDSIFLSVLLPSHLPSVTYDFTLPSVDYIRFACLLMRAVYLTKG